MSHPPFVTALRDTDGDGIADDRRTLVRGLGFGLDFRGADHTTNGIEMGIDGWLYVAVGDYGFVKATGADGQEIQLRGGGNVRVRPDGTELEIYSRGTRNDYDLAIDPYLNLFARGNTNDGGGFDIRLYHFVAGATFGYPSLFRNFNDEVVPPLADYGTGSGTGMLYVHDAGAAGAVRQHAVFRRLGQERDLSPPAPAEGRDVLRRAGGLRDRAAADRHGDRRQLAAVPRELGRRPVPICRARRSATSPGSRTRTQSRRRRSISRPPPTRGSSS